MLVLLRLLCVFHRKDAEKAQARELNNTRTLAGRVIGKISALSHRLKLAVGDIRNKQIPKAVANATKDANADIEKKLTEAHSRLSDPRAPMSFDLAACTAAASSAEAALKTWEQLVDATASKS